MAPPSAEIRPGQPGNEPAFGPAYEAAGGRARLGRALGEVYEDGPGWVQQFDGGSARPAVICARVGHPAIAVDQEVWDALAQFGRGTYVSGVAAVGFPVPVTGRPLIAADGGPIELAGGQWGDGRLVPLVPSGWRWHPAVVFDSSASAHQDDWSFRRGEMDLRLRLAGGMLLVAEDLRITEAGRDRLLAALPSTGLADLIASLAKRYGLATVGLTWKETPEPEGFNNSRFAAYQLIVPGHDGRPALIGSLWSTLPGGRAIDVGVVVDLCVDFEAIQPATEPAATPARIAPGLQVTSGELVGFFTCAWPTATALVLTTGQQAAEVPPAGPSRLELYIQNRHPVGSGGERVLRTEDLVDLSVFGRSRKSQLGDLSVGVTIPLDLDAEEIGALVRQALKQMASDYGFTGAETAQL